jgi:hypothetical protein
MSGHLVVAELGAWVAGVALLAAGALCAVAFRWARARMALLAPRARERALIAWVASPWVLAGLGTLGCFLPSLLDWLGGAPDHCGVHGGHHLHLCFHHAGALERSVAAGALGCLVALATLGAAVALAVWGWRYLRLVGGLEALSEADVDAGYLRVATRRPLALTLGLLRPQVFLSEGLEDAMPPEDLAAVVAHEEAHVVRRDGLRKLAVAALSLPFPPQTRTALLAEYAATCEESCDVRASEVVGEPARVARAILAAARLGEGWEHPDPVLACRFAPGHVERRVRALLATKWPGSGASWTAGFGGALAGAGLGTGLAARHLHHAVETALALVF